jgi:hypothetical protein
MNTQDIEAEIGELLFQLAGLPLAFQAAEFVKNIDADPLTKWHMQQTVLDHIMGLLRLKQRLRDLEVIMANQPVSTAAMVNVTYTMSLVTHTAFM